MRRGECEIELQREGADVVIAIRDSERRHVTLRISRPGARAFAALAKEAASGDPDIELRCAVKGEVT